MVFMVLVLLRYFNRCPLQRLQNPMTTIRQRMGLVAKLGPGNAVCILICTLSAFVTAPLKIYLCGVSKGTPIITRSVGCAPGIESSMKEESGLLKTSDWVRLIICLTGVPLPTIAPGSLVLSVGVPRVPIFFKLSISLC